jgi:subfamily B ATP-binding cassette protein MsbA
MRRFLPAFGAGAFLVVIGTLLDLLQPWPLAVIIDGAILHKPLKGGLQTLIAGPHAAPNVWNGSTWVTVTSSETILVRSLVAFVILVGLSAITDWSSDMLMDSAGENVVVRIRRATYGHLQRLSLGYHDSQRVGDLTSRVTLDIDRVQSMLVAIFDTFVPNIVMLIGLAVAMIWIDPAFGLLALCIAPPLFFLTYRYTMRIKYAARRARDADARIASHANETLSAVRSVQAFNREEYEDERFAERNEESLGAALESVRLRARFTPSVDLISLAGTVIVTYVGVHQVMDGSMPLGVFLVFLSYVKGLYKPMRSLSKMAYVVSRGTTSAERVEDILNQEARIPEVAEPVVIPRFAGRVELDDVTFQYPGGIVPVLEDASLTIEPGEHIGIIGRTGAGKSTLVSLIPRFYDADSGAIRVDGVDVREMDLASLRRQVSLVLQEPVVFFGTIMDNIRYGNPDATDDDVWRAAEAAHVTEFLDRLPDGLDTVVGERGATLSGGQRQRICVARAILADAPILILDEPTTGLDRESEEFVLDGLAQLSQGRTTIVISHHEPALRDVHRIIHIADRHISEVHATSNGNFSKPADLELSADAISDHTFTMTPDGYAPEEVNRYLAMLREQLQASAARERALIDQLDANDAAPPNGSSAVSVAPDS